MSTQYHNREIQADSLEFHENVEFHNCVIHANEILVRGNALFNNTGFVRKDELQDSHEVDTVKFYIEAS